MSARDLFIEEQGMLAENVDVSWLGERSKPPAALATQETGEPAFADQFGKADTMGRFILGHLPRILLIGLVLVAMAAAVGSGDSGIPAPCRL
ncbi:hypothetical protein [Massilia scottii]|uniref:hypothetical protein n=1 Tax=Massilia scottii TaxID=3057166 RepID=UPI002796BCA1|nr:hypothetical protein [Massilia sp. CCM 9029]MDQ1830023.1 hypothetical protein [Massilia sp. CCM 9029]